MWVDQQRPIAVSDLVRTRELDDDLVVYHCGTDLVSHLDPIARIVWESLASRPTFAELVAQLSDRFHTDRDQIATDVSALLDELLASELIELVAR